jgi:hypothetical protein
MRYFDPFSIAASIAAGSAAIAGNARADRARAKTDEHGLIRHLMAEA